VAQEVLGELFEAGFRAEVLKRVKTEKLLFPVKESVEEETALYLKELKGKSLRAVCGEKMFEVGKLCAESVLKEEGIEGRVCTVNRILAAESPEAGHYRNADLLLFSPEKKELFIFELTLGGASSLHDSLVSGKFEEVSDLSPIGVGLDVNYFQEDFLSFVEEFTGQDFESTVYLTEEVIKALQSYSYALSFLAERKEEVETITVRILYPHREGIRQRFLFRRDEKKVEELLERTSALYRRLKGTARRKPYRVLYWKSKMRGLTERVYRIPPERGIDRARETVRRAVFTAEEGEVKLLLHPPGTGKTTAVMEFFLSLDVPALMFLFTPRRFIVEDKRKRLEGRAFVIDDSKDYESSRSVAGALKKERQHGRLKLVSRRFRKALREAEKIAVITTTQALVEVSERFSTVRRVRDMAVAFLQRYPEGKIVVAVDELLGDEGSIPALKEIIGALKEPLPFTGEVPLKRSYVFGLDANLVNPESAEKLFEKLRKGNGSTPSFLMKVRGESSFSGEREVESAGKFFGVRTTAGSYPSFPTKEKVSVRTVFLGYTGKNQLLEKLKEIALKKRGTYVYVQDKPTAISLRRALSEEGFSAALITSTMREEDGELKGKDFIISTSSASRGVDVPVDRAVIVLPSFGIEGQIAEVLQAVFRIREGKETKDKEIILVAPYYNHRKAKRQVAKELLGSAEEQKAEWLTAREMAVAYKIAKLSLSVIELVVSPSPDRDYYVPVPKIQKRKGRGMEISTGLTLLEVLKDRNVESELVFDFKLCGQKGVSYPYLFHSALASFEFKSRESARKVKALIEKDRTVPESIRKDLLSFLNALLRERGTGTVYDECFVAELLFLRPYSEFLQKTPVVVNASRRVGREELSTISGRLWLREGRVYLPVTNASQGERNTFPIVPVEMIPV